MKVAFKKIQIKGYNVLNMYPVYVHNLYEGREPFTIVGIREHQVELKGDFSAMNNTIGTQWFNNEDVFVVKDICEDQLKANGCQVHNIYCCGGGSVIRQHTDYWNKLIE